MISQPEDATITITSVVEVGELEHARKQYPGCVESGEDLSEIAKDNRQVPDCFCGPINVVGLRVVCVNVVPMCHGNIIMC